MISSPPSSPPPDIYDHLFDDDALTPLEKIYLFSRSSAVIHRAFISRSLHTFLCHVSPSEAVEYVLPLLILLATDNDVSVKEALVTNLVPIMWWFFENCILVEHEPPPDNHDPPLLPVQTFTPILGSLLIDPSSLVSAPARIAVVDALNRLRMPLLASANFGPLQRSMLEHELVHQVIIGMARLDLPSSMPKQHTQAAPDTQPEVGSAAETQSVDTQPDVAYTETQSAPDTQPEVPHTAETQSAETDPAPETALLTHPLTSPGTSLTAPETAPETVTETASETVTETASEIPETAAETMPLSFQKTVLETVPESPSETLPEAPPDTQSPPDSLPVPSETPPEPPPDPPSESPPDPPPKSPPGSPPETYPPTPPATPPVLPEPLPESDSHVINQAALGRRSSMSLIASVTANTTLPDDTTRAFTHEVSRIANDPLYWVRREAAYALGALAKVIPLDLMLLTLLPLFTTLTHDPVWHVRHSAIFALPGILARLDAPHRRALALDTLCPLAADAVPAVRSAVLEVLGEVIYTFHADPGSAPGELVALFVGTPRERPRQSALRSVFESEDEDSPVEPTPPPPPPPPPADDDSSEDEHTRGLITSFNYPAVALSLGAARWGELRAHYLGLAHSPHARVRRTVAAGLGEMARILGSALAARDLLGVWDALAHDADDAETRLRVLRGLVLFVRALAPGGAARRHVVGTLVPLWEGWLRGWRERECVAAALGELAPLVAGQEDVVRALLARALVDFFAAVREAAMSAVWDVLRAFGDRPHVGDAVRGDLESLAHAEGCRRRTTYIACYRTLVESGAAVAGGEVARAAFWEHMLPLSRDPVVDVRIGAARLLAAISDRCGAEEQQPGLGDAMRRLAQDPARDVRAFVEGRADADEIHADAGVMYAVFSRPPRRVRGWLPEAIFSGSQGPSASSASDEDVQRLPDDWDP